MKVTLRLLFPALLLLAFIWIAPQNAFAKEPLDYIDSSFVFDSLDDEEEAFFYDSGYEEKDYPDIVDWESTDEKVATAYITKSSIDIHPVGVGECDVAAIDEDGNKTTIHVTVKKEYIVEKIKRLTSIMNAWYGTKKLMIESATGASGKVVIGKDTYKIKIPEKGEYSSFAGTTVKLKKVYKLNTKATVTLTVKSNGVKCTYKKTVKLASDTWVPKASGKKKKLTLTIYNPHKGDVVKVTYKGKTYSKKIKKNKDRKMYKVTFELKKKLKKNSSFKVVIRNKDKKVLDKEKIKLKNYYYEYVYPSDHTDYEDDIYGDM